jgi:signal transduction histidine kinase
VLDHAVAIHLYRIAQEAVSNAVRHGKAGRIEIGLTANGKGATLTVSDNGTGMPRKLRKRTGMGLQIMRYRAEVVGATLAVEGVPGEGTQVVCSVTGGELPPEARNGE